MAWDAHSTKVQTAALVEDENARRKSGRGFTWLILHNDQFCVLVSLIGILRAHRVLTDDQAELAYWTSLSHLRGGFMNEARRRVLDFAFQDIGLHKVRVSHFAGKRALLRIDQSPRFPLHPDET
jgi:RimJ/RimL family protein N-acetyltransferase